MPDIPELEKPNPAADNLHMHKGEEVFLNKLAPVLRKVKVGLGWDAPGEEGGAPVDIDASAFLLGREGRVRRDTDFVFYNNLETEGGVRHTGDNTNGTGDGDDEAILLDLEQMPFDVDRVSFSVTIHNGEERGQTFGIVKNAFIRIVNEDDGRELAHFDLTEDASDGNAMIFGELVRDGAGWKFRALGTGSNGGLYKIARDFGVNVAPA
jgi:tellurium resistance protein TerD